MTFHVSHAMGYHGRRREGTHIVKPGFGFKTLCGRVAIGGLDGIFAPGEVSCRECRRRWQLATGQLPAKNAHSTRQPRPQHEAELHATETAQPFADAEVRVRAVVAGHIGGLHAETIASKAGLSYGEVRIALG